MRGGSVMYSCVQELEEYVETLERAAVASPGRGQKSTEVVTWGGSLDLGIWVQQGCLITEVIRRTCVNRQRAVMVRRGQDVIRLRLCALGPRDLFGIRRGSMFGSKGSLPRSSRAGYWGTVLAGLGER